MIFEYLLEAMSLTRIARIRKSNTEANVEINRLIFLTRIIRPSLVLRVWNDVIYSTTQLYSTTNSSNLSPSTSFTD